MEGWILLGKTKKVSSIMVDVWSARIRRGHFLFLCLEFICWDFEARRSSLASVTTLKF